MTDTIYRYSLQVTFLRRRVKKHLFKEQLPVIAISGARKWPLHTLSNSAYTFIPFFALIFIQRVWTSMNSATKIASFSEMFPLALGSFFCQAVFVVCTCVFYQHETL